MACFSRDLPSALRCERPSDSVLRLAADQPLCLAVGPDEKKGRSGLSVGSAVMYSLLAESSRGVGTAWPVGGNIVAREQVNAKCWTSGKAGLCIDKRPLAKTVVPDYGRPQWT